MKTMNDLPPHMIAESESINRPQDISWDERDNLYHCNTVLYWHCFYDPRTKILYNQYFRKIMDDAFDYLLQIGLIDKDNNQIKGFQEKNK